ncbi:MAG: ABC transporter ATP-binding protein [Fretibacterium sp.]|nr:ABC transporter ATP-binding protein [Fretibacterium sp.]
METVIKVEHVGKEFDPGKKNALEVLSDVSFEVKENEFICIVGPSGCGKSTLLRILSGLESATEGQVLYRGEPLREPRREIGVVFQNYSLMPWLTVRENISLGLKFQRVNRQEIRKIVQEYLEMIGMESFAEAYPHELSGGMRQRVAIARSLASDPDVVLMDEPFGALDAYTRILLQKELLRIWNLRRKTILFVTHGVDESVTLADRILLMSRRNHNIVHTYDVDMERPRDRTDPRYGRLTQTLLEALEQEQVQEQRLR